jgi:hypothetical protein
MAAGEGEQRLAQVGRHAPGVQQRRGVRRREIAEPDHRQRLGPPRVRLPAHVQRGPSGQDDERADRHPGQEPLTQPAFQSLAPLEGVDQQHRPLLAQHRLRLGLERRR